MYYLRHVRALRLLPSLRATTSTALALAALGFSACLLGLLAHATITSPSDEPLCIHTYVHMHAYAPLARPSDESLCR